MNERDEVAIRGLRESRAAAVAAGEWVRQFREKATKLNAYPIAGDWWRLRLAPWRLRLPADEAAAWASLGYLPGEAAPLIAAGVTPQMAADLETIATDVAGSPEERAAQVIDRLVAGGILVDPARVRTRQDPNDPTHTIVNIDPEALYLGVLDPGAVITPEPNTTVAWDE